MNSEDTRNLFLAIALSVLVMAAWQYFYAGPRYQREHPAQTQTQTQASSTARVASQRPAGRTRRARAAGGAPRRRRQNGRRGARGGPARRHRHAEPCGLDRPQGRQARRSRAQGLSRDCRQKEPAGPSLLASGAPDAYWADTGFVGAGGVKTPKLETVWTADAKTLTPERPVTLTWDNGEGLVFKRVIAVDDKYMFTITDSVANSSGAAVTLRPYGLVLRHGMPHVAGYSVLHEGFEGVDRRPGACADLRFRGQGRRQG